MSAYLDEAQVEIVTVDYFRELGYEYVHGPQIAPDGDTPERADYGQVVLLHRLRDALVRINADVPDEAIEDAIRQVTRPDSPSLVVNNRVFHRMLTDGVDGPGKGDIARSCPVCLSVGESFSHQGTSQANRAATPSGGRKIPSIGVSNQLRMSDYSLINYARSYAVGGRRQPTGKCRRASVRYLQCIRTIHADVSGRFDEVA